MVIINLYLTFLILILLDYKFGIYPLAKWIFPICNLKFRNKGDVSNLEVTIDIAIHSIFIISYLYSIGLIKIVII